MRSAAKNSLLTLLANEKTRHMMGRLALGQDPRLVVAEMAGQTVVEKVAQMLGAPPAPVNVGGSAKVVQTTEPRTTTSDVTDAEYVVINVTPGTKKAPGKEK